MGCSLPRAAASAALPWAGMGLPFQGAGKALSDIRVLIKQVTKNHCQYTRSPGIWVSCQFAHFRDKATEDINYGRTSKAARRLLPASLHEKARIKLARLHAAETLRDLMALPGNRFEALKGDRQGQYSIRLNDQYRICFEWNSNSAERVEVVDYH